MVETPDQHSHLAEAPSCHRDPTPPKTAARICWHASQIRHLLQRAVHELQGSREEVGEHSDALIVLAVELHHHVHGTSGGSRGVLPRLWPKTVNKPSRADGPALPPDSA